MKFMDSATAYWRIPSAIISQVASPSHEDVLTPGRSPIKAHSNATHNTLSTTGRSSSVASFNSNLIKSSNNNPGLLPSLSNLKIGGYKGPSSSDRETEHPVRQPRRLASITGKGSGGWKAAIESEEIVATHLGEQPRTRSSTHYSSRNSFTPPFSQRLTTDGTAISNRFTNDLEFSVHFHDGTKKKILY
jgi:hypothetical protein